MILLLGASGYIGKTFASELRRRGHSFIPLMRAAFDYTRFDYLFDYLRTMRPVFLINAASYSGQNTSSQGERERLMAANTILPQMIARACLMTKTPWGHISSGSIYTGAKVAGDNGFTVQRRIEQPETLGLFDKHPERFRGFSELDEPNFTFRNFPCNFYSGTKALAEEAIREIGNSYIWRFRLPFNDREDTCNWMSRMRSEPVLHDSINSFSHLEDCARACLDLWELRAPFGIYNIANPGAMSTCQIVKRMERTLRTSPAFLPNGDGTGAQPPASNCILDVSKLLNAGIKIRPVTEAVEDSLDRLRLAAAPQRRITPLAQSAPAPSL